MSDFMRKIEQPSKKQFYKNNSFLFFTLFLFFHLTQLRIPPLESATRPYVLVLLLPFLTIGALANTKSLLVKGMVGWIPFLFICLLYSIVSLLLGLSSNYIFQPLIGFIAIFLFYCIGYTALFMRQEQFVSLLIYSYIPIILLGWFELFGLMGLVTISEILDNFRNTILTVNLSGPRLRLLFSEPSFIATFILMGIYLARHLRTNRWLIIWLFSLSLFLFFSFSLVAGIVVFPTVAMIFLKSRKQFILTMLLMSLLIVLFVFFSGRDLSFSDPSSYIRFLHFSALINMFIESFGFGMGFGSFSSYFKEYLGFTDLFIIPSEIEGNLSGEIMAVPYSVFFRIVGEMGVLGAATFILLFKRVKNGKKYLRPYYVGIFLSGLSALPFGLPYAWLLLGIIDRENDS